MSSLTNCIIIYKPIQIVWLIKDIEGYGFGNDKHLYNLKTAHCIRQISNNGCIGYKIKGEFYSLTTLRNMLYKPKQNCIF